MSVAELVFKTALAGSFAPIVWVWFAGTDYKSALSGGAFSSGGNTGYKKK
jgi:hypothetical protein